MSPFLDPAVVRELEDFSGNDGPWELVTELRFEGARDSFLVPAGFRTDFASVPRPLWGLFPPFGRHTRAAILHDWCYVKRPLVVGPKYDCVVPISRRDADGLFRRNMKDAGTSFMRRWLMWAAVRAFGWIGWRDRRRRARLEQNA